MPAKDITVLNSLIATTIDSANGYEEAAKRAKATGLASQFAEFARDRWAIVPTLQREVTARGGKPKQSGTAKAAAHRRWLDVKHMVSGGDRAILQEVENGETYIRTKYEAALASHDLSEDARRAISDAFTSIRQGHDRVRALNQNFGTGLPKGSQTDWRRVGTGLGIAAALGGALYAANRVATSRRSDGNRTRTGGRRQIASGSAHTASTGTHASAGATGTSSASTIGGAAVGPIASDTSSPRSSKRGSGSKSASLTADGAAAGTTPGMGLDAPGHTLGAEGTGSSGSFSGSGTGGEFGNR